MDKAVRVEPDIARIGILIGDKARARVLLALLGGSSLPAGALAAEAGIGPATMSVHLAKLVAGGLLTVERRGRNRYFRLAGPAVAEVLAAIARIAPPRPMRSLRQHTRAEALRRARTCYDHLAGRLGVAVMDALIGGELITRDDVPRPENRDTLLGPGEEERYQLTEAGRRTAAALGVDLARLSPRRPVVGECLDWSEGRVHLAGALGAAMTTRMIDSAWVRPDGASRVVQVTGPGRAGLHRVLGVPYDFDRDLILV